MTRNLDENNVLHPCPTGITTSQKTQTNNTGYKVGNLFLAISIVSIRAFFDCDV